MKRTNIHFPSAINHKPDLVYCNTSIVTVADSEKLHLVVNFSEESVDVLASTAYVAVKRAVVEIELSGCQLSDEDRFSFSHDISNERDIDVSHKSKKTEGMAAKVSAQAGIDLTVGGEDEQTESFKRQSYQIMPSGAPGKHKLTIVAKNIDSLAGAKLSGCVGTMEYYGDETFGVSVSVKIEKYHSRYDGKLTPISVLLQHLAINYVGGQLRNGCVSAVELSSALPKTREVNHDD